MTERPEAFSFTSSFAKAFEGSMTSEWTLLPTSSTNGAVECEGKTLDEGGLLSGKDGAFYEEFWKLMSMNLNVYEKHEGA